MSSLFYPNEITKKKAQGIREQYLTGVPTTHIAKNFNLKQTTSVYYYLHRYGGLSPADKALHIMQMAEWQRKSQQEGSEK